MRLKDKVAVITGASSGIGKDIAYLYAKEGARVYAVARRIERLEELAKSAECLKGTIIPIDRDLMNKEEVEEIIDIAYKDAGKLDILVNNAGIMDDYSPVGNVTDEMLEKVFRLNVFTPFYTCRRAVNIFLKEGGGNIVNISSISGMFGARTGAVYTASKHALSGLTKNTGFMYAKKNIRCNAICPGIVDTEISSGDFSKYIDQEGADIIMPNMKINPRRGKAMEIAHLALFLGSDESSFINGQCIIADSGYTAF